MRGREGKTAPAADLLVCFPSRAHLTLMPKPICSPARPSEPTKRHHPSHRRLHHHYHHHPLKKSGNRGGGGGGGGQASPLLWAKSKPMSSEISEPTSPKVTCAGQIKVRPKSSSCKNWQSVVEEIERIHNSRKLNKKPSWVETLGFKKEIMQFLTCLRSIRFDFRCFGSMPESHIATDDDDEEELEGEEFHKNQMDAQGISDINDSSRTVFSKWFMVLQENQNNGVTKEREARERSTCNEKCNVEASAPPPNALLLMRCRSAPAKSWLEEKEEEEEEEEEGKKEEEEEEEKKRKLLQSEEEKKQKKENLVVMRYDADFYKFSSEIAKETWIVGGLRDPLSRSRSWKR